MFPGGVRKSLKCPSNPDIQFVSRASTPRKRLRFPFALPFTPNHTITLRALRTKGSPYFADRLFGCLFFRVPFSGWYKGTPNRQSHVQVGAKGTPSRKSQLFRLAHRTPAGKSDCLLVTFVVCSIIGIISITCIISTISSIRIVSSFPIFFLSFSLLFLLFFLILLFFIL